jgi:hypothetical protein
LSIILLSRARRYLVFQYAGCAAHWPPEAGMGFFSGIAAAFEMPLADVVVIWDAGKREAVDFFRIGEIHCSNNDIRHFIRIYRYT